MEKLKNFGELLIPDERWSIFISKIQDGVERKKTLGDIYKEVDSIKLHDGVPEIIRTHFAQAQNLAVYSWFYYPFNVTTQIMATVSVEFALKIKLNRIDKYDGLKKLIKMAVDKKLVSDEGFSISKKINWDGKKYIEGLYEAIPYLRNDLVHGSSMLHHDNITPLKICAELINQLYENSGAESV